MLGNKQWVRIIIQNVEYNLGGRGMGVIRGAAWRKSTWLHHQHETEVRDVRGGT